MLTDTFADPLILVVEDDESHASLIQRSFEDATDGYRLEIVGTLGDARPVIERNAPDLVLTDYRLPDGDGSELVAMVNRACPVILMTSQGNEQVAVTTIKAGARDYIVKSPETFSAMPRVVNMALREWRLVQDRRKVYEAVRRGKQEWEQTFDAVSDLIAIIDNQHNISRVNRAMAERCGLSMEDIPGRKCYELFHGTSCPPAFCPHVRMLLDGREHTEEVEEKNLAGFFDVRVSPLHDDEGIIRACVHVSRDITERKKAEEDRQALEQRFQQTQKLESLGVLAGGIAHDFNNILTIILGHCFLSKEDMDSGLLDKSHLLQIEAAANRAADLCRQMLTYAGKSPLVQEQIHMRTLVDEIVKMLTSAIKKNVSFELDLTGDVSAVTGDRSQIQQVVMNLIINASEAIHDNNGTVRVALTEEKLQAGQGEQDFLGNTIPDGTYACLEVSDSGCGMDQETQKRIFEPFFTTKFTGRGLGMSAILGIVKSHGGVLQLSSKPGAGSTFKVYFPVTPGTDCCEVAATAGVIRSAKRSATILLVDDEEELRSMGAAMLASLGFTAITASDGLEALQIFRERGSGIDLILMDLIMPRMGGIQAYAELRKMAPSKPIVFCSGYDGNEVASSIDQDDHAGFVTKPYRPDQLHKVLTGFLDTDG